MAARSFGSVVRQRLLGLLLLVLVVAAWSRLSIAIYDQVFTTVVTVKLETDHTGNQLLPHSDVKERGVIVGEVALDQLARRRRHDHDGARPGQGEDIKNVYVAQILPKTLFGEQYVSLIARRTLSVTHGILQARPAGRAGQARPDDVPGQLRAVRRGRERARPT